MPGWPRRGSRGSSSRGDEAVAGTDVVVVALVTVPTAEVAERIATTVVGEHLAACVNVVPGVRSLFFWEGRVQDEPELLLTIKTTAGRLRALAARVRALHPYSVPELVALPVVGGHAPYLAWVSECVEKGGGEPD